MSHPPLLVVEHEAMCPPGWMGVWLAEASVALDVRRAWAGEPLPATLAGHAGLLVLGGSMDAYADAEHPWLTRVKELVREAAATGVPTLGICLGHQLATVALGGEVTRNPRGQQIGVLDVGWCAEAEDDPLLGRLDGSDVAVQWNNDIAARLPEEALVLARTPQGEVQAARLARTVWGVQWHPEADDAIVREWASHDRDEARERGVDVDGYVEAVAEARDLLHAAWRPLARRLAAVLEGAERR